MKSVYDEAPWLRSYPDGVPPKIEIPEKSVNELFDEATEKWKDKVAIKFYGKKISYQKLREKVDRFATALFQLGVKKGDRVGFLMINSPEYIIAFYGTLKVGAIITPISPVYVSSEIQHQLEDSGARTIICQDILYEVLENTGLSFRSVILTNISESLPFLKRVLGKSMLRSVYQKMASPSPEIYERAGLYRFQELIKKYPPNPPEVAINPREDPALLPYTGGTTGPPKGVVLTHYNPIACDVVFRTFYPCLEAGKEVFMAYMPFYHAGGQFISVLTGILRGDTLVVLATPEPDDIIRSMVRDKVTFFVGAPAIFEILKDYKKTDIVNWKKLKLILCGADALHEATSKKWESRTGISIVESFGMTETVSITHGNIKGREKIGSIGIPIPNVMAAIVDPDKDEFLPVGETGELVLRGPQVTTKGYWNNPEATRECEAIIGGVRWWRTGDLGRMEKDGFFYIYDRKRDLIKYKGLRVFAREVEEVLKSNPHIRDVGVIGLPDVKVGENVKALVLLESDARGKVSETDIIDYCQGKLAHYKIPKIIEFVGEIPKTDVGKVSRRELREEGGD